MEGKCNNCSNNLATIPFVAYAAMLEKKDRVIKRLWISHIFVTFAFVVSNAIWIVIK
jgi:hypothetical protein